MTNISSNLEKIITKLDGMTSEVVEKQYGTDIASRVDHISKQLDFVEGGGSGGEGNVVVIKAKYLSDNNEESGKYCPVPWNFTEDRAMLKSEFDDAISPCIKGNSILKIISFLMDGDDADNLPPGIANNIICIPCRLLSSTEESGFSYPEFFEFNDGDMGILDFYGLTTMYISNSSDAKWYASIQACNADKTFSVNLNWD